MNAKPLRIGIYGGTFDPVHFGHLLLAETARETLALDQVLFVPAKIPPHKQGKFLSSEEDRTAMLERALKGNRAFKLERFELLQNQVSFTVHTVEFLKKKFPHADLFLLMGEDMLRIFPNWFRPERICELATPAVIGRAGHEIGNLDFLRPVANSEKLCMIQESRVPMPSVAFSSTMIREAAAAGRSIRYQTPASVVRYIQEHKLYQDLSNVSER